MFHNSVQIIAYFICSKHAKNLLGTGYVGLCLFLFVRPGAKLKMKQRQYSSLPCFWVLCILGNNLKQLEKKIFETTTKCMTLTSCESAPRLKWGVTRLRKKQTPMQQSRRRRVHQGNTQARDNPDPEIFVAYNIFDRLFTQNLAVPKCAACQAVQRTILTSMVMLRTQCVPSDLVCWA